jgi:hypothetical protein
MKLTREDSLMPAGVPRYARCYDNGGVSKGGSIDRYTVVYTGRHGGGSYVGMSAEPFHPQGVGQHGESRFPIDRPGYSHLGKPIRFENLPPDCRKLVLSDYKAIWNL